MTEPYYREYFSDGQNYVQATRSLYSGGGVSSADSGDNHGSPGMAHPGMAAYESRLAPIQSASDSYASHHNNNNTTSVNKNTPIYAKAVTAAGLTVDLPSPDSGIGADAITPRDQTNIQQVSSNWKYKEGPFEFGRGKNWLDRSRSIEEDLSVPRKDRARASFSLWLATKAASNGKTGSGR